MAAPFLIDFNEDVDFRRKRAFRRHSLSLLSRCASCALSGLILIIPQGTRSFYPNQRAKSTKNHPKNEVTHNIYRMIFLSDPQITTDHCNTLLTLKGNRQVYWNQLFEEVKAKAALDEIRRQLFTLGVRLGGKRVRSLQG